MLRRPFLLVALAASALLAVGCGSSDYRPDAVGREGEVTVVVDSTYWNGDVGEALQEELGRYVGTLPQPVREFDLNVVSIEQMFEQIKRQKNVVFVAPLNDSTPTARFLRSRIEGSDEGLAADEGFVYPLDDVWRQNQQIVYVGAGSPDALAATIRARGEDLRYAFNEATRERITEEIFARGRQRDLEEQLLEMHDFTLQMQADWRYIPPDSGAYTMENFVWLRRNLADSWRSLFVYYVEDANPAVLTPDWVYATQDSLTERYMRGEVAGYIEIDYDRPLETEEVNFLGRYGFETRGLWDMRYYEPDGSLVQIGQAGPFLTYAFYEESQRRIYLMSSMLFAPRPRYDKQRFLRDLEAIMHTFQSSSEVDGALAANE